MSRNNNRNRNPESRHRPDWQSQLEQSRRDRTESVLTSRGTYMTFPIPMNFEESGNADRGWWSGLSSWTTDTGVTLNPLYEQGILTTGTANLNYTNYPNSKWLFNLEGSVSILWVYVTFVPDGTVKLQAFGDHFSKMHPADFNNISVLPSISEFKQKGGETILKLCIKHKNAKQGESIFPSSIRVVNITSLSHYPHSTRSLKLSSYIVENTKGSFGIRRETLDSEYLSTTIGIRKKLGVHDNLDTVVLSLIKDNRYLAFKKRKATAKSLNHQRKIFANSTLVKEQLNSIPHLKIQNSKNSIELYLLKCIWDKKPMKTKTTSLSIRRNVGIVKCQKIKIAEINLVNKTLQKIYLPSQPGFDNKGMELVKLRFRQLGLRCRIFNGKVYIFNHDGSEKLRVILNTWIELPLTYRRYIFNRKWDLKGISVSSQTLLDLKPPFTINSDLASLPSIYSAPFQNLMEQTGLNRQEIANQVRYHMNTLFDRTTINPALLAVNLNTAF